MFGVSFKVYSDNNDQTAYVKIEKRKEGKVISKITVRVGDEFVVKPNNKLKKKNRDRRVQILKFNEKDGEIRARVKFIDNDRRGIVPLADLEPLV